MKIIRRELEVKFIREFSNPDGTSKHSKKKLSEILYARHPDLYRDSETARTSIRSITGSSGYNDRISDKYRLEWKGLSLPKPEKNDYSKVIVNEKRNRYSF